MRNNSFVFKNLPTPSASVSYLLDIACRDYDFVSYGVDVDVDGVVEVYRIGRGGAEMGKRVVVGEGPVEVKVVKGREFYQARVGCEWLL